MLQTSEVHEQENCNGVPHVDWSGNFGGTALNWIMGDWVTTVS